MFHDKTDVSSRNNDSTPFVTNTRAEHGEMYKVHVINCRSLPRPNMSHKVIMYHLPFCWKKTAVAVLASLVMFSSVLKTASWKRRVALTAIDLKVVMMFLLFYAGPLANVFVLVTVAIGVYWVMLSQHMSVTLPLPHQEKHFVTYIICAFALKAIQFLHKLTVQLSVDIFFIDWERPRNTPSRPVSPTGQQKRDLLPVSIWRTYIVANAWIGIQTIRKIKPTFQIMAVLFFLEGLGFSKYTVKEPLPNSTASVHDASSPTYSPILRYGLASSLWLGIGLLQATFTTFYEICVYDKFLQFVDLCSISNISVLLLPLKCFGYYIHGRSVHGHADTNMEEMNNNLRREAESLCGQRGLLPCTDMQTFQVALSTRLRSQYDRIRESFTERHRPTKLNDPGSANHWDQSIQAYTTMNHFLGSIIDHAHTDMDYYVKDKLGLEIVMDIEFLQPIEKSIFYNGMPVVYNLHVTCVDMFLTYDCMSVCQQR
ncbi:meckelin-like isoform X2 [Corythoichthys intestinalis]|uniref:meckelin-like isoform X2 n=1 Tax=Corythoichthys intestinalis TaxID=161448 RepID=UPI0025A5BE25|nr:meckelin-like isoform X2 [Corythoichthys intestinalis]